LMCGLTGLESNLDWHDYHSSIQIAPFLLLSISILPLRSSTLVWR
jgi:hypothetical protein